MEIAKSDGLRSDFEAASSSIVNDASTRRELWKLSEEPDDYYFKPQEINEDKIEGDPVVISIRGLLESLSTFSPECCIYKVPEKLRKRNEGSYAPRIVSIGPIHHGQKGLQAMEEHKLSYLQSFLHRTKVDVVDIVREVRTWEEDARHSYAETIDLCSDDFVQMLVVDGSFIIELLWRYHFHEFIEKSDRIFRKPRMLDDVSRDMSLLENQLPFFVLERLFERFTNSIQRRDLSLVEFLDKFFKYLVKMDNRPDRTKKRKIKHLVDFLREYYLPLSPRSWDQGNMSDEFPPSATELHEAGVKFKKGTSSSLLDIEFKKGSLTIPHLEVDDDTESFFRNLMAFEQCHCIQKYIINYMLFMDSMINTAQDVDLLAKEGIITRKLGSSEDVCTLFNNICKDVVSGHKFYFFKMCKDLNAYCRIPRHYYMAVLRRDYFNTPWTTVSFFAAIILLGLTIIQTMSSIKSL